MKFIINFNREKDNKVLEKLGAKLEYCDDYSEYYIEIEDFNKLEEILKIVDELKKDIYSAVISFDSPSIYLDKDV